MDEWTLDLFYLICIYWKNQNSEYLILWDAWILQKIKIKGKGQINVNCRGHKGRPEIKLYTLLQLLAEEVSGWNNSNNTDHSAGGTNKITDNYGFQQLSSVNKLRDEINKRILYAIETSITLVKM